jgi:hypothetical protein
LGGLVLNAAFHWQWAGRIAALVMVSIVVKKGFSPPARLSLRRLTLKRTARG